MKKVSFYTLGCKVNRYETEAMSELFEKSGYEICDFDSYADIYVINTCTVTAMSDRKSRGIIRRAKKHNPNSIVVVTGCYAQTNPDAVAQIEGVNIIIGTQDRGNIVALCEQAESNSQIQCVSDIMHTHNFENLSVTSHHDRTRAFIKIQEGCNQFCSYCIIPYARGPVRSREEDEVIKEAKNLVNNGYTEIVFAGIHVASYGIDNGNFGLLSLLKKANDIENLKRIRLSSIEPMTLDESFISGLADCTKLCHHFHLSLQSGCDETLKRMNRKYTSKEYEDIVSGIRKHYPDAAVTTDIMVGFPGETDEEFEKTAEFVKKIKFADAHIFKYSQREGTPAAKMKNQVASEIKEKRSKVLIDLCAKSRDNFISSYIGKSVEVLFEQPCEKGLFEGKTSNYITVKVKTDENLSGIYKEVKITGIENGCAVGEILN